VIITGDFNSTPGDKVCLAFISLPFEADLLKRASCFLLSSVIQSVVEPSYYRGDSESFFFQYYWVYYIFLRHVWTTWHVKYLIMNGHSCRSMLHWTISETLYSSSYLIQSCVWHIGFTMNIICPIAQLIWLSILQFSGIQLSSISQLRIYRWSSDQIMQPLCCEWRRARVHKLHSWFYWYTGLHILVER